MPQRNGIKRRDAKGKALAVIPADLQPAEVLERYLNDERTADIAASYGVARSRLNQWLLEHCEEPWRKAQVARAISAKDSAQDLLESAADPLSLARAREQLRGAQWELERLYSRLFGQKQEVSVTHDIRIEERLSDRASELLSKRIAVHQEVKLLTDQGADSADSSVIP